MFNLNYQYPASKILSQSLTSNPNSSGLDPDVTSSPIHKHPCFQLQLITCYYLQPAGPRQRDSRIRLNLFHCAAIMALIIRAQIKFRPDISNTQALVNSAISLAYAGHYPESTALSPINPPPLRIHTHTHNHRVYKHLHTLARLNTVQCYANLWLENTKSTAASQTVWTMLPWLVIWDCFSGRVNWKIPAGKHAELILRRRPGWCV